MDIEALKDAGAGRTAPEAVAALYREAYARYGVSALWSRRAREAPTIAMALVVADALRREGDMEARRFAARIEEACRAAVAGVE